MATHFNCQRHFLSMVTGFVASWRLHSLLFVLVLCYSFFSYFFGHSRILFAPNHHHSSSWIHLLSLSRNADFRLCCWEPVPLFLPRPVINLLLLFLRKPPDLLPGVLFFRQLSHTHTPQCVTTTKAPYGLLFLFVGDLFRLIFVSNPFIFRTVLCRFPFSFKSYRLSKLSGETATCRIVLQFSAHAHL